MFLRIFKGYQAILLIVIPLVGILLWMDTFFIHDFELDGNYVLMPLGKVMFNILGYDTFFSKFFAFILVFVNSLLLVRMNIKYNFLRTRTYLPAIVYIVLISFVKEVHRLTPALAASTFVILAIDKMMYTFKRDKLAIQIMDASLYISFSSLFYFPALFLLIYLWIGLLLLRPFKWREWLFTILGVILPYLIVACILYISGKNISIPFEKIMEHPFIVGWQMENSLVTIIFFAYVAFLIFLASIQIMKLFGTKKVHSRRFFIFFLWLFVLTIAIYFLVPSASIEILYISALPVSYLYAHFFINLRSQSFAEILFFILIALVVGNKFLMM